MSKDNDEKANQFDGKAILDRVVCKLHQDGTDPSFNVFVAAGNVLTAGVAFLAAHSIVKYVAPEHKGFLEKTRGSDPIPTISSLFHKREEA